MSNRTTPDSNLVKAMEVFVAVVDTGQMTAAARLFGMTQSAASQQIAILERIYETQLLDRSARPLRPTRAGVLLHRHAERILNAVTDLATDMRHQGPKPISVLRAGILASIATTLTPDLVSVAKDRFGVSDVTLHAGQSGDHETLLQTKRADIAITTNPFLDRDGFERHPVLQETYLLVLPRGYRRRIRALADVMSHLPLIRFADTTSVGRQIEQHLRRLQLSVPRIIQADRSSMVTACVAKGMGFTVLTPTLLIDGLVEQMPLDVRPLPAVALSRAITVVSREEELGDLPAAFAALSRTRLLEAIDRHLGARGRDAITLPEPVRHP